MKTKKESRASLVRLSEPWRNIGNGQVLESKKAQPESKKFRIAGYVRLSPTGDEREEGALVSHPQRIKQFVESKNIQSGGTWGDIVDWYVDKDLSGKDMNRPAFQKMLADIKSGRINAVVVTELSRLNRKVKDFLEVYEFFKAHNIAFFCLRESFDTSTAIGELMLIQAMSFAQYERQTIVDRIKKGARARAERGLANGYIPLGFSAVEHRPNYREVNQEEKAYVEMIFRKFLELGRLNKLVQYLNAQGYKTKEFTTKSGKKTGGNRWTICSLHSLLTNRAYIGEREVNKKHRSSDPENIREDDRYFFVEAHWPALISKELFFDVQHLLEQNKKKARKYIHEYRLTGLIECAECGAHLVGKSGTGRMGKYFYYGHKRKMVTGNDRHTQRCQIENVPALPLEEAIINRLKDLSSDRELLQQIAQDSASESSKRTEHTRSLMGAKEQERRKLNQKIKNIYDAIEDESDKAVRAELMARLRSVSQELAVIENAISELANDLEASENVVDVSEALRFLREFREGAFDSMSLAKQAEFLRGRIRKIIVKDGGVYVEVYGRKPERLFQVVGGESPILGIKKPDDPSGSTRSSVLTVSKLVGAMVFPPTPRNH